MLSVKKVGVAALAALTIAGSITATTTGAEAHWRGGGGYRGGGYYRGGGFGIGAGIATGLALGAIGGYGYRGYGYGYPAYGAYGYDGYGGDCVLQRRVRYTPYGPVVRHVRVCY